MAKKEINKEFRQQTHDRLDKALDKAEQINENTKETLYHLKEKAKMMRENFDNHIRRKPERSVLIAAGIGVVIGSIVTAVIMKRRR